MKDIPEVLKKNGWQYSHVPFQCFSYVSLKWAWICDKMVSSRGWLALKTQKYLLVFLTMGICRTSLECCSVKSEFVPESSSASNCLLLLYRRSDSPFIISPLQLPATSIRTGNHQTSACANIVPIMGNNNLPTFANFGPRKTLANPVTWRETCLF